MGEILKSEQSYITFPDGNVQRKNNSTSLPQHTRANRSKQNQITQERKHIVQPDCPHFHFFATEPTAVELLQPPSILKMPKIPGRNIKKIKHNAISYILL